MARLLLALVPLAITMLVPAPASATTVSLSVRLDGHVRFEGTTAAGVKLYAVYVGTRATVTGVVSEGGVAKPNVTVQVSRQSIGMATAVRIGTAITDARGQYRLTTAPSSNVLILAHVDATPSSATQSADALPVQIGVAPRIVNTSRLTQVGQPYRITGRTAVPDPRRAGQMLLERRVGGSYVRIAWARMDGRGGWRFAVVHRAPGLYRYRISFLPAAPRRYLRSSLLFAVRFRLG